jgi:hypothetical protein
VRNLHLLGFDGPYSGTRHEMMRRGNVTLRIPNPHRSVISRELLSRLLTQAGVSRDEWERL